MITIEVKNFKFGEFHSVDTYDFDNREYAIDWINYMVKDSKRLSSSKWRGEFSFEGESYDLLMDL